MGEPELVEIGVIHGRFQVLHRDHLAYLLAGKALCKHLVVGITNPDPGMTKAEDSDPHRSDQTENPLTYFERYILVRAALHEAGISEKDISIVPFPINLPERYCYYVPLDALFFLTIYDDWGRRKLEYFQQHGLKTWVLRDVTADQKGISASTVRGLMRRGEPWRHLVPDSVANLLEQWDIAGRLRAT